MRSCVERNTAALNYIRALVSRFTFPAYGDVLIKSYCFLALRRNNNAATRVNTLHSYGKFLIPLAAYSLKTAYNVLGVIDVVFPRSVVYRMRREAEF